MLQYHVVSVEDFRLSFLISLGCPLISLHLGVEMYTTPLESALIHGRAQDCCTESLQRGWGEATSLTRDGLVSARRCQKKVSRHWLETHSRWQWVELPLEEAQCLVDRDAPLPRLCHLVSTPTLQWRETCNVGIHLRPPG